MKYVQKNLVFIYTYNFNVDYRCKGIYLGYGNVSFTYYVNFFWKSFNS